MTFILRRRTRRELEADEAARRAVAPGAGRDLGNRTCADVDGLVVVAGGEWVYPQRGLSVVTNQDGTSARHLFGFVPTTLDAYRRLLRPDLATVRRPAAWMTGGDEL